MEVRQLPEASVGGAAVADLTHLLAEIVENAAQFSPPHTRVRITGEPVGNGYAVEVEDRGLGMGKETLDEANRRIEQSEALDLFDSDRLVFVVSRLAARHGIKVHLRTSPYGGTTAVVLLPTALLHGGAAERSPRKTDNEGPDEREYARVSAAPAALLRPGAHPAARTRAPGADRCRTPSARLAGSPHGTSSETPLNGSPETTPPGATTLRLHRPPHDRGVRRPPTARTAGEPRAPTARTANRGADTSGGPPARRQTISNSYGTVWRPTATAGRAAAAEHPGPRHPRPRCGQRQQ